jgi:pimeloyl-ACP methyl ester carboxylesterase
MKLANRDRKQFWLADKLDLDLVAAMGHSAGAAFAARACQLDSRFKACVDLDGAMVPVAALPDYDDGAKLQQPLLFLEAFHPNSQMGGTPDQQAAYFKKKEEQLQTSRPGSYNVVLRSPGIAHPSFSDDPLLFAGQNGYPERPVVLHNLELIERYVLEFLGGQLKQQATPLLNTETDLPEVSIRRYGR